MSPANQLVEELRQVEAIIDATYKNFRILSNGVLVRQREFQHSDDSGLIEIPEAFRREFHRNGQHEVVALGEVVAVGNGHLIKKGPRAGERIPLVPQIGETVLFVPSAPSDEIVVDGEKLWVVHENHVLGVVES